MESDAANVHHPDDGRKESVGYNSNVQSRHQQKAKIKKEYTAATTGFKSSEESVKATQRAAEGARKTREFVSRHKKGFAVLGILAAFILLLSTIISSCSVLVDGLTGTVGGSTYPVEDSDMLAAEAQYLVKEQELQSMLDNYESTHSYDEYHFDLDEIGHDPYVLISAITALYGGEWKIGDVQDILDLLFQKQYILTEEVTVDTRYRTETRTEYEWVYDPFTNKYVIVPHSYTVEVPYEYTICTVKLENFDLSHVQVYIMSEEQLSMYAMYMATLGNRPDVFGDSSYVSKYYTEYEKYEIPPEALEDEQFAAMIAEAEKYLGYPYVWGGSSPETSFDCSGFVSWVINHCGVGWDIGRLGAEGLRQLCTKVSPANAKPGDLIFFQGTYDTPGASHVGIYVGEGMMLHCGDPIQYTSFETNYWQNHFMQFGRLPNP